MKSAIHQISKVYKSMVVFTGLFFIPIFSLTLFLFGCVEEPVKESAPELITKAILTFTPTSGPSIVVSATDPDGEGVQDIAADGTIILGQNKSYTLSITLLNELADQTSPDYNITNEVESEGDEHIFYFEWTNNLFSSPLGDGNVDNRSDEVGYGDTDFSGFPIGLSTNWATASIIGGGTFRVLLKHQPGLKSATSGSADGETDLDLTFDLEVK